MRKRAKAVPARRRLRALAANLLLAAGSLLAISLVLEGVMRALAPQPLGLRYFARDGLMVHFPGARIHYARGEFDARVSIDGDGLRDRDYPPGKPPGVFRVLVLGDSFTDALQVQDDEVWVKRVEAALAPGPQPAAPSRIEFVNAGLAGAGTADELRYLERRGERWRPDLVLLAFYCGNDVRDNLSDDRVHWDGTRLELSFRAPLSLTDYSAKTCRYWLASHSHLYQFVRDRFKPSGWLKSGLESAGLRDAGSNDEEAWQDFDDKRVIETPPPPEIAAGWDRTRALLDRMGDSSRALGARFATVSIPTRWMLDEDLLRAKDAQHGVESRGDTDPSLPGRTLCAWAASRGVPCLDLFPPLGAGGRGSSYYYVTDAHWNASGHAAAAALIVPWIRQTLGEAAGAPDP